MKEEHAQKRRRQDEPFRQNTPEAGRHLRWVATVLLSAGLGAVLLAALWDVFTEGRFSFGQRQTLLMILGVLMLLLGAALHRPSVRRGLSAALERSRARAPAARDEVYQRPHFYLLLGLWTGLAVGLIEVCFLAWRKLVEHEVIFRGIDLVWMIPLFYAVVFGALGLGLYAVARLRRDSISLRAGVFVLALLGFFCVFLRFPALHKLAVLVLAAGLAVQTARLAHRYASLLYAGVRRSAPWVALVVAALAVGAAAWRGVEERAAVAALPTARPGAPNVLLLVLDTVRAKSLSLYGYERQTTPALEALAEKGVVFEQAFSTAPWTLPSHGGLFTGRYLHELGGGFRSPLNSTYPTLAEELSRQGYSTAGFVANRAYVNREVGLGRGFAHYEVYRTTPGQAFMYSRLGETLYNAFDLGRLFGSHESFGRKSAEQLNRDFLGWLEGHEQDGRPFFAFLNYFDAHRDYLPPIEFATKFTSSAERPLGVFEVEEVGPEQYPEITDAYDGALAYLDHHLGRLFAELERRGVLENTLVIVTADHGELLGEHGMVEHIGSLYTELLHVPLLIVPPSSGGVPASRRVEAGVSLREVPATVLDLAGLGEEVRAVFPGRTLARYWTENYASDAALADGLRTGDEVVLAEVQQAWSLPPDYPGSQGRMKSVIYEGRQYIKNYGTEREELYDLVEDPNQMNDLAGSDELLLQRYRGYLDRLVPEAPAQAASVAAGATPPTTTPASQ